VGARRPFYSTSLGKAMLAHIEDPQHREELLSSIHFERTTPKTITSLGRLKKQLATFQERGYALDDEEAVIGVRCLGAPIFGQEGTVVGAISISGPVVRITSDRLPLFSREICKAAREISVLLGARPPKSGKKSSSQEVTLNGA
jgi:IclR family acetate operon transcriptional repressor